MSERYDNNAHSLDGLEFFFESDLSSHLSTGDFVVLRKDKEDIWEKYFGIIEFSEIISERFPRSVETGTVLGYSRRSPVIRSEGIRGSGRILGKMDETGFRESFRSDRFDHYRISHASNTDIKKWSDHKKQSYEFSIGKFLNSEWIEAHFDAKNFSRHTFLSGQTGSGKSSAIRTILKRVLQIESKPKIIVFDLNSEYKDFCTHSKKCEEFKSICLSTKINNKDGNEYINIDFFQLEDYWKLSIINVDPIENPTEFCKFREGLQGYLGKIKNKEELRKINDLIIFLQRGFDDHTRVSGNAFNNIDLQSWDIWKSENTKSLLNEVILGDYDLIDIDLGSIKNKAQRLVVASFVLEFLWKNREEQQDFLIVIDEAHNIIPCVPVDLLSQNITERMIDIAGEGRKYGLSLLICSQQPSKIHENVLSLCNNLILLQTTSIMDLESIYSKFSCIPRSFINKARFFKQGEALVGGPLVETPVFLKIDYLN